MKENEDVFKTNAEKGITRLAKRLSELGLCSRREADDYILKGWVSVNGSVVREKGFKVVASDKITLNNAMLNAQDNRVTIILNKPVGYVSAQAEKNYKPAASLITGDNRWEEDDSTTQFSPKHLFGLAPAGRLDIDSQGLLVLTQDGRVAKQLIGAHSDKEKEYLVRVVGNLIPDGLALLNHGLTLDEELLKPATVYWVNDDQLKFILQQGKKRQIRRMCELVGLKVIGLKRIRMGKIKLGNLPSGKWRYLKPNETF